MKKLVLVVLSLALLAGCAKKDFATDYSAYQGKTAAQIYNEGKTDMDHGNYSHAVKAFEAMDAIYPFGPYAQQAQLDIIYAYYKSGDNTSAIIAADRYIHLYPRSKDVPYAYYMKGIVSFQPSGTWLQERFGSDRAQHDESGLQQAYADFAVVSEQYPNSEYAPDSRVRMAYIRNELAQHQLEVGQFYYEHKAYVASANRALNVVEHYEGAPQVIPALAILVRSYRNLQLNQEADYYTKLLKANYPNSQEAKSFA